LDCSPKGASTGSFGFAILRCLPSLPVRFSTGTPVAVCLPRFTVMRLMQMIGPAARNVFKATAAMTDDVLRVAALLVPCLLGLRTAVACRRAHYHGLPGADALVWAGLSAVFFLLSLMKTARGLGLLRGFGDFLRGIFKQRGWYEDRRSLQITASIAVAVVVAVLVVWGLLWAWHRIKRYRLAIGFAGLTVGFGIIRFISLHEVDAWNANAPWARTGIDLVAAAGVSALAIARFRQLNAPRR
jgi:hypothetical protein